MRFPVLFAIGFYGCRKVDDGEINETVNSDTSLKKLGSRTSAIVSPHGFKIEESGEFVQSMTEKRPSSSSSEFTDQVRSLKVLSNQAPFVAVTFNFLHPDEGLVERLKAAPGLGGLLALNPVAKKTVKGVSVLPVNGDSYSTIQCIFGNIVFAAIQVLTADDIHSYDKICYAARNVYEGVEGKTDKSVVKYRVLTQHDNHFSVSIPEAKPRATLELWFPKAVLDPGAAGIIVWNESARNFLKSDFKGKTVMKGVKATKASHTDSDGEHYLKFECERNNVRIGQFEYMRMTMDEAESVKDIDANTVCAEMSDVWDDVARLIITKRL